MHRAIRRVARESGIRASRVALRPARTRASQRLRISSRANTHRHAGQFRWVHGPWGPGVGQQTFLTARQRDVYGHDFFAFATWCRGTVRVNDEKFEAAFRAQGLATSAGSPGGVPSDAQHGQPLVGAIYH